MKYIVSRIERVKKEGKAKETGNPYSLDFTNITVLVPVSDTDQYGSKETTYQYGSADNFAKLDALRGKLPCEVEMDLGIEMDKYGNPKTVFTDVKLPQAIKA
ncbi:hypothetical protein [Psychrobacter sp. JB385]|uniref:hypothetical protein n=1 Tax=Psychrobacter sp. JB385 TaxID=1434841 RepID=UPI00097F5EEA|nr:hypothetical protein [Psychrobacter sp. JB385]SJN27187.1 hypothetical protein CZ794_05715 [Psychrobacter sp. JB385]